MAKDSAYAGAATEATARNIYVSDRLSAEEFAETKARRGHVDWQLLILTVVLLGIGLIMLFSASFANAYYEQKDALSVFKTQLGWAVIGIGGMLGASIVRVSSLKKLSYRKYALIFLFVSIGLLTLTIPALHFPLAIRRNNATRWLGFGSFQFQPSELVKLGIILGFAHLMCKKTRSLKFGGGRALRVRGFSRKLGVYIRDIAPFVLTLAAVAFILTKQPHTSALIIVVAIGAIMMFADGFDMRLVVLAVVAVAIIAALVIMKAEQMYADSYAKFTTGEFTIQQFRDSFGDYKLKRIVFWLHPEADPIGGGYQILQSLYAIGSGGLTGQGFGQSRQKFFYLPEEHNDYIFAIICEEIGFIGAFVIVIIFALLILRGFWIAMHARDKFSSLIVIGIMGMLAVQVFLNIAVVTNSLPCTGISLPFFSYGGTALLIQLIEMGIVLSVSRDMPIMKIG